MSQALVLIAVLVAGMLGPSQVAMNSKLEKVSSSPMLAALISFIGGGIIIAGLWAVGFLGRGKPMALSEAPWWAWCTGPVGILVVVSALVALPRSSAAVVIALTILGQSIASLVIDHYGWMDVKRVPVNAWRIGGVIVILAGTLMMQKK